MKKTSPKFRFASLCVATLALVGAACGEKAEDFSDEELQEKLHEVLVDAGLDSETSDCIVDGLWESAPRDQINRMANAQEDSDFTSEDQQLLVDVTTDCAFGG